MHQKKTAPRYFPKSSEFFDPENFFPGYCYNELALLEFLTYRVWKTQDWVIWASHPYILKAVGPRGIKSGSIKRYMKRFRDDGHLVRWKRDNKHGNEWLVSPRLLWEPLRQGYLHWDQARTLISNQSDHNDPTKLNSTEFLGEMDLNDPAVGSLRSYSNEKQARESDHNDPQYYTKSNILKGDDASRQKVSFGPIGKETEDDGEKGVGSLADIISTKPSDLATSFFEEIAKRAVEKQKHKGVGLAADEIRGL